MRLNFGRRDSEGDSKGGVGIVIISASCCVPGMEAFDEQARRAVEQAITETGVEARVKVMPATTAFFGGAPRKVMGELMAMSNQGKIGAPAILVNGQAVSYGSPVDMDAIKSALLEAGGSKKMEEGAVQK